jgi:DNA-binding PadR family transcriptional regulator
VPAVEKWTTSDAWFAAALATIGEPTTLDRIIEAGDAINHAIFTPTEIQQAVRRLEGSGLVEVTPDREFQLTAKGQALLDRRKGGLVGQVGSVHELLNRIEARSTDWTIDDAGVHAAYLQYQRRTP